MASRKAKPPRKPGAGAPGAKPTGRSASASTAKPASARERLHARQLQQQRAARTRRIVTIGAGILALVVVAVFVIVLVGQQNKPPVTVTGTPPNATANQDGIVVYPGQAKPGVPTVSVYSDYQCVHCLQFENTYGTELEKLAATGDIVLVFHNKVFLDKGRADGLSHKGAIASSCADTVGAYAAYHKAIFASAGQGAYTDQLFRDVIPVSLKLGADKLATFQKCYDDKATAGFVENVETLSAKAGVTGTPAILVNGKTVDLNQLPAKPADLKALIDKTAKG